MRYKLDVRTHGSAGHGLVWGGSGNYSPYLCRGRNSSRRPQPQQRENIAIFFNISILSTISPFSQSPSRFYSANFFK